MSRNRYLVDIHASVFDYDIRYLILYIFSYRDSYISRSSFAAVGDFRYDRRNFLVKFEADSLVFKSGNKVINKKRRDFFIILLAEN